MSIRPSARAGVAALSSIMGLALGAACAGEAPPVVTLEVERDAIVADGLDHTVVRARVLAADEGGPSGPVVVRFSTTAGALTRSAAPVEEGVAETVLLAEQGERLGLRSELEATVRGMVQVSDAEVFQASARVRMTAPEEEAVLLVSTEPAAVAADGVSEVTVLARARGAAAGDVVVFAGEGVEWLTAEAPLAVEDGVLVARGVLRAPSVPGAVSLSACVSERDLCGEASLDVAPVDGPQFDLTGTFAQLSLARVKLAAGTLTPNPQCVMAPAVSRVVMEQSGTSLTATWKTCHVTFPPVTSVAGEVTNEARPAFLAAIPDVTLTLELSSEELGATLAPPESVVVVGAALDAPRTEQLPSNADDPRVRDDDGDGRPGVTVDNSLGGAQDIVFRTRSRQSGRVASSSRIDGDTLGDLLALTETRVLGFGNAFVPDTTALPSVFQMVRVDGAHGATSLDDDGDGAVSCEEILAGQAFVFDLPAPETPLDCGGDG